MENRLGYHIPTYRLAKISELSAKIVKLIVCDPSVNYTRNEAHIILELAHRCWTSGRRRNLATETLPAGGH